MYRVRESWTDERLDDFRDEVHRRFDKVDSELNRVNDRLDGLHRIQIFAVLALTSTTVAGWASMVALIVTRT
jgi:hypothetical protein